MWHIRPKPTRGKPGGRDPSLSPRVRTRRAAAATPSQLTLPATGPGRLCPNRMPL